MKVISRPGPLSYAIRVPVVLKYLGQLCLVSAILSCIPFILSALWQEFDVTVRYLVAIILFLFVFVSTRKISQPKEVQQNEILSIIALLYLLSTFLITIPMMSSGLNVIDAWFEAVSGLTTTGLSVVKAEDQLKTFLFSRSYLQWVGGIGVVVLSLGFAMQPKMVAKGFSEGITGKKNLVSTTQNFAKRMLIIYAALSLLCFFTLIWVSPTYFEALIHTLSSVSTGGFSTSSESIGAFSTSFQTAVTIFSFLGAISFPLYWFVRWRSVREFFANIQIFALLISALIVSLLLYLFFGTYDEKSFITALFNGLSAQSTTGFSTIAMRDLPEASKLVMIGAMSIGGSTQSTAGGFKILRLCILLKSISLIFKKTSLSKHAVFYQELGGIKLKDNERENCLAIFFLFFLTVSISWLIFLIAGFNPIDSLFEVVSATGTVGLSTGITSAELPSYLKVVLCIDMFLGRLEFVTFLTLFLPRTLVGRRMGR